MHRLSDNKVLIFHCFLSHPAANAPKLDSGSGEPPPAVEEEEKKKQKRGRFSEELKGPSRVKNYSRSSFVTLLGGGGSCGRGGSVDGALSWISMSSLQQRPEQ